MPTLVMSGRLARRLDGSVRAKAYAFLEKLQEDDTAPGLHVEPINGSVDPRVRTGRVDQFWRAVMFKLVEGGEPHYVMHGIWPHDEAIAVAQRVTLRQNPINGMPTVEEVVAAPAPVPASAPPAPVEPAPVPVDVPTAQVDPAPPPAEPLLVRHGRSLGELTGILGLPVDVARAAMAVENEDAALALAEQHEGWVGLALVSLAAGDPVDTVVEQLGLNAEPSTGDEDADLVRALKRPAARTQFAFVGDQHELRTVIEGGDFAAWRVFLHPEQRRYVDQTSSGPFRLSGGAGTGKTVVLVHRARELARRRPTARIILTTYTRNLADALRDQVHQLDPTLGDAALGSAGVHISGVDALASGVLRLAPAAALRSSVEAVLGEPRNNPTLRSSGDGWRSVVDSSSVDLPSQVANPTFLADEYALVVLPQRVRTEAEYLRVRRQGRGLALDRSRRQAVWKLVEAYRAQARIEGALDFAEAAAVAADCLERMGGNENVALADHVLVDEGQDLAPTHWQLMRALAAPGHDDIFIAEDSHQRIYGPRTVLSRYGIRIVGRSRRLTLNYRTTAQNLDYALSLLEGRDWHDIEGEPEVAGYRSARSGPEPTVVHATSLTDELDTVAEHVAAWVQHATGAPDTIAVLVPNRQQQDRVVQRLTGAGVPAAAVVRERPPAGRVAVLTRHRAKGTEFARVVLTDLGWNSDADLRRLAALDESERADAELRERSLVYVAATRARDELVVIAHNRR